MTLIIHTHVLPRLGLYGALPSTSPHVCIALRSFKKRDNDESTNSCSTLLAIFKSLGRGMSVCLLICLSSKSLKNWPCNLHFHVTLRCVTLRYVVSRNVTLCHVKLRCVTLRYFVSRYVTLCHITLRCVTLPQPNQLVVTNVPKSFQKQLKTKLSLYKPRKRTGKERYSSTHS